MTGASSGIGQAIAVRFAQEGANVAINYRKSPEDAKETEEMVENAYGEIRGSGVENILIKADVSQEEDVVKQKYWVFLDGKPNKRVFTALQY